MQILDEIYLLKKHFLLDPEAPSLKAQALQILAYNQYENFEFYRFGAEHFNEENLQKIALIKAKEFELIKEFALNLSIALPTNDVKIENIEKKEDFYILAQAKEIQNMQTWRYLLGYIGENTDMQDLIFRLEANSYNEILPCLNATNLAQDDILAKTQIFMDKANKILNNQASTQDLQELASSSNFSLIAGAVLGAIGSLILTQGSSLKEDLQNSQNTNHTQGEENAI